MMVETRWWWVRHAPVAPQYAGRIYGDLDVPCDVSDTGAFGALADFLPQGALWLTSALSRTQKTAAAIRRTAIEMPEPLTLAALNEQSFGDWQGRTWDQLEQAGCPGYVSFWADPAHVAPPGGEGFADFAARVGATIGTLSVAHGGRDIVAIAHAGVIRAALALALDISPSKALAIAVDPLSVSRLDSFQDGEAPLSWRVGSLNVPAAHGA